MTTIIVASGLPRAGTSLVMQMLAGGGVPLLTDNERGPDEFNPRGYFECASAKRLRTEQAWLAEAVGKAVKIVAPLLVALPARYAYQVVWIDRNLDEVIASQQAWLAGHGRSGAEVAPAELKRAFARQLDAIASFVEGQANFSLLRIDYADVIAEPASVAERMREFLAASLDRPLDVAQMAAAVDPNLHRRRCSS